MLLSVLALIPATLSTPPTRAQADEGVGAIVARPAAGDDTKLDYEALARSFRERHGIEASKPSELDIAAFVEKHFVVAQPGIFDVFMPRAAAVEISGARDFGDLTLSLLRLQKSWLDFSADESASTKQALSDIKTLEKWFKGLKPGLLASSLQAGETDFFAALQMKDDPLEAKDRLRATMLAGEAIGLSRTDAKPARLILIPERRDFVEFLALVGWQDETNRSFYWVDGIQNWTEFFYGDFRVLALQYAEPNMPPGVYDRGLDMNQDNPNRMAEQICQIGANAMLENYYGDRMPGAFLQGLSMCLVIDVFGEVDTRIDGDLRSRETQGRSIFIPGGQSEGGRLPKFSADSDWRSEQGRGWFVRQLRQSQKGGGDANRKAPNRFASFEVKDLGQSERHVVSAPFFGSSATKAEPLPDTFGPDFQELLRSYKTAFLHWLRTESMGKNKSGDEFGALLKGMTAEDALTKFEALFTEIYDGAPLSDGTASKDSLEGKFLVWLSKQKS